MLEIIMIVAAVIAMTRIASADNQSSWIWGSVTLGLCVLSMALPWPMIRIGIAFGAAFFAMFMYKVIANE